MTHFFIVRGKASSYEILLSINSVTPSTTSLFSGARSCQIPLGALIPKDQWQWSSRWRSSCISALTMVSTFLGTIPLSRRGRPRRRSRRRPLRRCFPVREQHHRPRRRFQIRRWRRRHSRWDPSIQNPVMATSMNGPPGHWNQSVHPGQGNHAVAASSAAPSIQTSTMPTLTQ